MKRHIVLLGLPGAGKTTVGKLLAERLGAPFVDLDAVIVRRMQMPVSRIFGEHGESKFRVFEAEAMKQALTGSPSVIAPGGGWAAQPNAMEEVRSTCLLVYLKTMALSAAKRAADGTRPLLVGEDPVEHMRQILKEREPFYHLADCEIKTDVKSPAAIADEIAQLAQVQAGW